jgi:hypothetical protein
VTADAEPLPQVPSGARVAGAAAVLLALVVDEHARRPPARAERLTWTMPPLDRLAPAPSSPACGFVLVLLRAQIALAAVALVVHASGLA